MKIFKSFLAIFSGTLSSRILGFLRDMLMAKILGASIYSDIFFVAFKLPNLFRRIFSEGAFSQVFMPSLVHAQRKSSFIFLIGMIFSATIAILCILVVILKSPITQIIAPGFDHMAKDLAAPLLALNFWYLLFIFVANFLSSILMWRGVFWSNAFSPVMLNLCMIAALFLSYDKDKLHAIYLLSLGVLFGGASQVVLNLYVLARKKSLKILFVGARECIQILKKTKTAQNSLKSSIKGFFAQFLPAVLGSSVAQFAAFLDTIWASFLMHGQITYLYYANRIFQLPLALFPIAISALILPNLSRELKNKDELKAKQTLKIALWWTAIVLSICTIGTIALSEFIVKILFQRGAFGGVDSKNVALVLNAYILGLLPFGLSKIISQYLSAKFMQKKMAKISSISLFAGSLAGVILMQKYNAIGLALGSSLGGVISLALTLRALGTSHVKEILNAKKFAYLLAGVVFCGIIAVMLLKHIFRI